MIGVGIVPCKWGLLVVDISEQMFYNWDIATGKRVVVKGEMQNMKKDVNYYRRKIIALINKTDDLWILEHILKFVQGMTKEKE